MSKLICITPRLLTEDKTEKQFVNTRYVNQINKRGFNSILLTLENPNQAEIFNLCDAFLITGGTDLDPSCYHEANDGLSLDVDLRLDSLDKDVIEYAIHYKKPLLGICRGLQSLNVFLGGTLKQDLGSLNDTHKNIKDNHIVHMVNHPYFAWGRQISVNSYHHQAIKDLAPSLQAIGTHKDSTIEMAIHNTLPIFAVQWHPEITPDSPYSNIIFDAFLKLIK